MRCRAVAMTVLVMVGLNAAPVQAATDRERCADAKLKAAGRYALCRLLAKARAIRTGDPVDYGNCDARYATKWNRAEHRFGNACASGGDLTIMQGFLTTDTDHVINAVTLGSPLPNCSGDLSLCNANLGNCSAGLAAATVSLAECNGDLSSCSGDLSTCDSALGTCDASLDGCESSLSTCSTDLATADAGTAVEADVLGGISFSSGAGLGLTGTMPNNGAVTLLPSAAPQTIEAGFHNGGGTVAGDVDLAPSNIVSGTNIFGVTGSAGVVPAPPLKTGETTDYGPGSDGNLQNGASRSFTDNGDGTITDHATGLMWEKKSNDGSIHDLDNQYSWGMLTIPFTMNGTMVTTFLAALNSGGGFAGYTDWRIPNLNELETIRNFNNGPIAVHEIFNTGCAANCTVTTCSCAKHLIHWSSTTLDYQPQGAWAIYFSDGSVRVEAKTFSHFVRAVRTAVY